jgi:3-dehydroquinate dehydratase type I
MPGITCKVYTSIFFDDFKQMEFEFENGLKDYSDHYEIRYDLFKCHTTANLRKILEYLNTNSIDYIFTFRSGKIQEINKIYSTAMNYSPPIVDVDIKSFQFRRDFFSKTNLMVSYHGANKDNVRFLLRDISQFTPDIYKIAIAYTDKEKFLDDLAYLYHYKTENNVKLAYIPMGENNGFLRLVSAGIVSDYAYASYKGKTAPGQIETTEFISLINRFKEKYE